MNYETLLKNAPPHDTDDFIDYLRENNKVVWENPQWIVIENFKYHTTERPWYTAFHKEKPYNAVMDLDILENYEDWKHWEWLKKSSTEQTVKRFHIHIYKTLS